ncbi:hypothetical protein ACHAWF_010806 [Thalassiosira exigua]
MVGMPLSEMPSFVPSLASSSVNTEVDGKEEPIRWSELRFWCLELVLTLPKDAEGGGCDDGNGSRSSEERPGFGTEKRGHKVHPPPEVREGVQAADGCGGVGVACDLLIYAKAEEELTTAREEADRLRGAVVALQDERESWAEEAKLFEAELSAAVGDKEYLEREAEAVRESFRSREEALRAELAEARDESSRLRGERDLMEQERDQLNDKVEDLVGIAAAADAAATSTPNEEGERALRATVESLQQEMMEKDDEIEQLNAERDLLHHKLRETEQSNGGKLFTKAEMLSADGPGEDQRERNEAFGRELSEKHAEIERLNGQMAVQEIQSEQLTQSIQRERECWHKEREKLREECVAREERDRLRGDVATFRDEILRLRDENGSLLEAQRASHLQIAELQASVESMDHGGGAAEEVDRLAAEVASLTYELSEKTTECEESATEARTLRARLNDAEGQLVEVSKTAEAAACLEAVNESLKNQVIDLQSTCRTLERQKSDMERNLEERAVIIQRIEDNARSLNDQVSKMTTIENELSHVRKSLDAKEVECAESASALKVLETELDAAKASLATCNGSSHEGDHSTGQIEQIRAEKSALNQQLASLRVESGARERDLEQSLKGQQGTLDGLKAQVQELMAQAADSTTLREELAHVSSSLESKERECRTISKARDELESALREARSEREVVVAMIQEDADGARDKIARLESQAADLLRDHNATMQDKEGQLSDSLRQVSTLNAQCEEYTIKLENAKKECTNAAKKHGEQVSKLLDEKAELSTSLQTLQSALDVKQTEATGNVSKVEQLQRTIDEMQTEINSMESTHQELLQNNQSLAQEKSEQLTQSLKTNAYAAEQQVNLLQLECTQLRSTLASCQKRCIDAEETATSLKEQLQSVKEANVQLEDKLFDASFEKTESDQLFKENESLRKERGELRKETQVLSQQINDLASLADNTTKSDSALPNGNISSPEKEALLARIKSLEEELNAKNLNELRDELTSLHEERQQLDLDNEELLIQLGLMQQGKLETQAGCEVELEALREQVLALQDRCNLLQNGQDRDQVATLSEKNEHLNQTISQLNSENDSLKEQIGELTQKIEGLELQKTQTIKTLRQKLGLLELKLADKEEEVESAKNEMRTALERKDNEISKLTMDCSSRTTELKQLSDRLDAANHEMGSFSSQIEVLQSRHEQEKSNHFPDDVGEEKDYRVDDDDISLQDLLAEAVLDSGDDYLRSQIVVLAQALERSELQRADALERIFSERKSNGESLRQLGESVKRFYSTVRCGDA